MSAVPEIPHSYWRLKVTHTSGRETTYIYASKRQVFAALDVFVKQAEQDMAAFPLANVYQENNGVRVLRMWKSPMGLITWSAEITDELTDDKRKDSLAKEAAQ